MDARTPQGDIKGDGVQAGPSIDGALVQGAVSQSGGVLNSLPTLPPLTEQQLDFLGLPNLGQSCYLNSALQSLLTLGVFSEEIEQMQSAWSSLSSAELLRDFVAIKASRHSGDLDHKTALLRSFKKSIALQDPEFMDNGQKDAHEFLICVLNQVWTLSPPAEISSSAHTGQNLHLPCGDSPALPHVEHQDLQRSSSKEAFTNLSLDLEPEGSVSQALDRYLTESSLEYTCQCGAKESGMRPCFLTLPNVLVLHLKRFRFTLTGRLEKVADRVLLSRELELSCGTGHYISEGANQGEVNDLEDQWLCYNDLNVSQTTGRAVRRHRQRTAYLLFYQRQALCRLPQKFCYNIMGLLGTKLDPLRTIWGQGVDRAQSLGWDVGGQTNITFRRPRAPRDHRKTQIGPVAARIGPATCQVQAGRARVSEQQLDFLGLPNLGQSCYLNSALQSLLTLGVFSEEIEQMQWAWSSLASAELLRDFVAVRASRRSGDLNHKLAVLRYHFRPQRSGTMAKKMPMLLTCVLNQDEANDLEDQLLCYNDLNVSQTTGRAVHRHRQRTAYLLFYQ
ncbi:Ubiquitin carboxyl-terminal hydrolase 37 [Merluccius polli]|uniref:Ubiquitin carboxyl-terminal hydrolase 37 n=1 Tax=Merluccius polli TaxID=89951 RepID=A0AA47M1P8_MERPO|nr:Ubiquitin carboxyl-terminal hydrolase 37 [Merluccius polli]